MTFTSVTFIILFLIVTLAYFLIPVRFRYVWLLFCSAFFYMSLKGAMVGYLLIASLIAYFSGLFIDKTEQSWHKKLVLGISAGLLILGLMIFKYAPIEKYNLFMPLGISFFTFQALSYMFDVYKGKVKAQINPLKVALFVGFFLTILSGPIQRGAQFMPQLLDDGKINSKFDADRAKQGLMYMLWGYFLKIVISGRISIMTSQVLGGYNNYSGSMLLFTIIFYAFLIYCDFAGYSYVAIGAGKVMGFDLGENFKRPYLCGSIVDFWRRWHISLSTWFRDYLYIPLGGNKKGTLRKYLNIMIVFAVSGIWHGNTVNFLIWGLLNGLYQIFEQITGMVKGNRIVGIVRSFILLDFAWIFFAVPGFGDAVSIIGRIFTNFSIADIVNGTVFSLGLGARNLLIMIFAVAVLTLVDIICEIKDVEVISLLSNVKVIWRWAFYYMLIIMILMSVNLSTTEFIYSQF